MDEERRPESFVTPVPIWNGTRAVASRAWLVAEWAALGLLAARLASWIADLDQRTHQADFQVFYLAGWRLARGLGPYGFVTQWGDSFVSPPRFALIVSPLSFLPYELAALTWLAISLASLATMIFLAQNLCDAGWGYRRASIAFLAFALWRPVELHLNLGQNSLLVAAAALGATLALKRGHPWMLLVVAASKPQLIVLLGPGLTLWSWRQQQSVGVPLGFVAGVIVASLTCLALTPAWVADLLGPRPPPYDYWGITINLRALLAAPYGPNPISEALYLAVLAAGSGAALVLWARSTRPLSELVGLTLAATLLLTPYAQLHDYVILVFPLLLLATRIGRTPAPGRWPRLASLIIGSWSLVAVNLWLHEWIEQDRTWLDARTGAARVEYLWTHSEYDWRFIAMLVPLASIVLLSWARRPRATHTANLETTAAML